MLHGNGKTEVRSGAVGFEGDRVHDRFDDLVADRRVHPGHVHGRHGRPVTSRIPLTIAIATLISGFARNVHTAVLMLGSRLLPPHTKKHGAMYRFLERGFEGLGPRLRVLLAHGSSAQVFDDGRGCSSGGNGVSLLQHAHWIDSQSGQRFSCWVSVLPDRTFSFESMAKRQRALLDVVQADPDVKAGAAFVSQSNSGFLLAMLKSHWKWPQLWASSQVGRGTGYHGISSKPAADQHQWTIRYQHLSNDRAERESAGHLRMGSESVGRIRTLPGFVDVKNLQIASPH